MLVVVKISMVLWGCRWSIVYNIGGKRRMFGGRKCMFSMVKVFFWRCLKLMSLVVRVNVLVNFMGWDG